MENKKKSCFVLLSTLLLTFLLGLSGNAYATEFSNNELKNIIYNSLTNFGQHDMEAVENALDSFDFTTYSNYTYEYDYVTIYLPIYTNALNSNSIYSMQIYYSNDNTHKSSVNNNYCKGYYYINYRDGVISVGLGAFFDNERYIQQNGNVLSAVRFNDLDLWKLDGSVVLVENGYHPSNINEGVYVDYTFNYTAPTNNNNQTITINGDTSGQTYTTIWAIYQANLGYVIDSSLIGKIEYRFANWNGHGYTFKNWHNMYTYSDGRPIWVAFNGSTSEVSNGYKTTFYLDTNGQANNILELKIYPKSGFGDYYNIDPIDKYFYITNSYSRIVSGVLYPTRTFSGDYEVIYNQQENTNDIISSSEENTDQIKDTLTDDSQVEGMLGDLTSGDTNTVAGNFGFSPIDNPFVATIRNVAEGVTDVLLGSGNATVTIGWHDYSYTLRSQDFILPSNAVVTLIHLICNGFFIWGIYKYGFKLYQWINSGRLQNLVNEANDHQYFWF